MEKTTPEEQAAADLIFFMNNAASRVKKANEPIDTSIYHSFKYNIGDDPDCELQILQQLFGIQPDNSFQVTAPSTRSHFDPAESLWNFGSSSLLNEKQQEDETQVPRWSFSIQRSNSAGSYQDETQFHLGKSKLLGHRPRDADKSVSRISYPNKSPSLKAFENQAAIGTRPAQTQTYSSWSTHEPTISNVPLNYTFATKKNTRHTSMEHENNCSSKRTQTQKSATSANLSAPGNEFNDFNASKQRRRDHQESPMLNEKKAPCCTDLNNGLYLSARMTKESAMIENNLQAASIGFMDQDLQCSYEEMKIMQENLFEQIRSLHTSTNGMQFRPNDIHFLSEYLIRSTMKIEYSEMKENLIRLQDILKDSSSRLNQERPAHPVRQHIVEKEDPCPDKREQQMKCTVVSSYDDQMCKVHQKAAKSCYAHTQCITTNALDYGQRLQKEYEIRGDHNIKKSPRKRQNKSRRCYFCRAPGHFIGECARASKTNIVDQDHVKTHAFYNHKIINEE